MTTIYSHVRITYRDGDTRIVPLAEYLAIEEAALIRTTVAFVTRRDAIASVAARRAVRRDRRVSR